MDEKIELGKPKFIPLASEDAVEATRLLAALIRAIPVQRPESALPPHRDSRLPEKLADGSPRDPMDRGEAASSDVAGGGQ